jgi:peptide/nickel transport system permease protein
MRGVALLRYIVRRLLQTVPVILGVVVLCFLMLQLAPGDLAMVLAGEAGGAPVISRTYGSASGSTNPCQSSS